MDSFLMKAYDRCNIGGTDEEKLWLSSFSTHIRKYILKENSSKSCTDLALSTLECITSLTREDTPVDSHGCVGEDSEAEANWTPYHVISLESLIKKTEICAGQISRSILNTNQPAANLVMPAVPSFLIGYLKRCPSSSETVPTCGTLFLEDNSSYLPIEISNGDIKWLNQLVILPSWTYIPVLCNSKQDSCFFILSGSESSCRSLLASGYLEATSRCCPVTKIHRDSLEPMPVCTSVSEYQESQRSNKKSNFNLHGKVTAVSPVHSIAKSSPFFFIQMTCSEKLTSTAVVVQGSQFMHWVNFLELEKQYILTDLNETTMNKGSKTERKILACTKSSRFLEYRADNIATVQKKRSLEGDSLQSKAENGSAKRLKRGADKHVLNDDTSDQEKNAPGLTKRGPCEPLTLSYKGVITKCYPQLEIGSYELDNKLRLYTVHQPCPHYGRGLRVGAQIVLYNVHLVKKDKRVVGLCCCTLSTLRVSQFSSMASEWMPSVFPVSPLILHGQNLSLPDYIDLVQRCEQVNKMFSSMFRPSSLTGYTSSQRQTSSKSGFKKKSIITQLLNTAKASSSSHNEQRNIYGEFFDHPHACKPTTHDTINLPTIYTLKELHDKVMAKSKDVIWHAGTSDSRGQSNEWYYQVISSDDLFCKSFIIGCLRASTTTGYLKLYDQTGSILLLVTTAERNWDSGTQVKGLLDFRGCILELTRFTVMIEQFRDSAFDRVSGSKKTRVYFQAKIEDLTILVASNSSLIDDKKSRNDMLNLRRARRLAIVEAEHKSASSEEGQCKRSTNSQIQANNIELKKSLLVNNNGNEPIVEQSLTSRASLTTPDDTQLFTCKVLFLVRHRENLMIKKKEGIFYACAVDIKVLAISSSCGEEEHHDNQQELCSDLTDFTVKRKSVVLRLQQQYVSWYPFLCDGCFYVLEERSSNRKCSLITKAMNYTSKPLIEVTSFMVIKQVYPDRDFGTDDKESMAKAMEEARERFQSDANDRIQTIEAILTSKGNEESEPIIQAREDSSTKQVNFRGRILSRELRMSDSTCQLLRGNNVLVPRFGPLNEATVEQLELGFGYLGNKNVFLRLRDIESPNTIDVYIDLSRAPYIDGLVPGAIITCRRFLSKISRGGNMYCSFDACSSLTIDEPATDIVEPSAHRASRSIARACTSESSIKQPLMSSVPHRFLIDFIKCETSGSRIHTISQVRCKVTAVQKVSLRWQCARCGHVIIREECSHGCATEGFKFSAEARCLIEDGTAEAMLHLAEDTLPFLLKLSHHDMSKLKSQALNVGELAYQRYAYGNDRKGDASNLVSRHADANKILADHCCSSAVKRSINIFCKHSGSASSKPSTEQTRKDYDTRNITINQTEYSTMILPKLHLRAVDMEDIDYQAEIQRLLAGHAHVLQTTKS